MLSSAIPSSCWGDCRDGAMVIEGLRCCKERSRFASRTLNLPSSHSVTSPINSGPCKPYHRSRSQQIPVIRSLTANPLTMDDHARDLLICSTCGQQTDRFTIKELEVPTSERVPCPICAVSSQGAEATDIV